jgi:condensin complex subunit 3
MVCTSWIKAARYNPVTLLQWVNVMEYTKVATTILQIWCDVSCICPSWFIEDFSEYEQQNFRAGLQDAVKNFTITDVVSVEKKNVSEKLFIVCNLLRFMTSDFEKDILWSRTVPDIPLLCHVLEDLTTQLVQSFASEAVIDNSERQEELIFLCTEVFQLTWVNVKSMEEGSRRILISTINNLLSNVVTPDDLLEGCVTTLKQINDSDDSQDQSGIELEIVSVTRHISDSTNSSDNELLALHASIRIISLIISVLETRDSISAVAMEYFVSCIHPAMSHENRLLRQASVRAWGLLGLLMTPALENKFPNDNYTSALQEIALNDNEDIEIRIQAMFALTDWVMLQFRNGKSISKCDIMDSLSMQIDQLLQVPVHFSQGSVCCAAEMATKLILCFVMDSTILNDTNYKERISKWVARLAMMYFEYENAANDSDNDPEDSNQVGHPVRLQQLLSVFFPLTTTSTFSSLNSYVLDSIKPLLKFLMRQQRDKKQNYNKMSSTSTTALLWTRTLDFIVSMVTKSRDIKSEQSSEPALTTPSHIAFEPNEKNAERPSCIEENVQPVDEDTSTSEPTVATISSPDLVGSLLVASFIAEEGSMINVTIRRALCKWIVRQTTYLDIEKELWEDLSRFKTMLEELVDNDGIDDASCRRMLEPVLHMLVDVESDNDDTDDGAAEDDDEVVESLSSAIGKVAIVPDGNENVTSTVRSTSTITKNISDNVSLSLSGKNGSGRVQRRLRPSN